jgi:hypothetical protein
MSSCRYCARYLPSSRYRSPYRLRSRGGPGGNAGKIAGAAAGVFLATAVSTHAAVAHHAAHHTPTTVTAAAPVTSSSETAFLTAALADLGARATRSNTSSLARWVAHETPWPPVAANNPLNSTQPMPGSTAYNYLPGGGSVQNYPTAAEGAQATARTLANGFYPQILAALKAGIGLCGNPNLANEFATWSGGGYYGVCS